MKQSAALMFDFADDDSASQAYSLLLELGYDPVMNSNRRLHIHIVNEDLISALEIAQAYGGTLVEQSEMTNEFISNTAYGMDDITIPAHIVNDDLDDHNEILPEIEGLNAYQARD